MNQFREPTKKRLLKEPPITIMSTWFLALQSPAKSYLKVSSKLRVRLAGQAVVERRLNSVTNGMRKSFECQSSSRVFEIWLILWTNLLHNRNAVSRRHYKCYQ